MSSLSAIRLDTEAQKAGVWQAFDGNISFRIARSGGKEHLAWLRSKIGEDATEDEVSQLSLEGAARFLIKDWRGIREEDTDEEIPYSVERAIEIMLDPSLEDIHQFVVRTATKKELFRKKRKEEALGNSLSASGGAPSTAKVTPP